MKAIWLILLTMVLFNGFLFTFSMFFETPVSLTPTNITGGSDFNAYKTPGNAGTVLINGILSNIAGVSALVIGVLLTALTKNVKYLAAGVMAGFISTLWTATASVFTKISSNIIILGIYSLISICIGIIAALLILSILTEQEQLQ